MIERFSSSKLRNRAVTVGRPTNRAFSNQGTMARRSAQADRQMSALLMDRVKDTQGSSVLIALVFFLICAIVGSIVITAASVNSKVTVTYREAQAAEYVTTSATRALGDLVEDSKIAWSYPEGSTTPQFTNAENYQDCTPLLAHVWTMYGDAIWAARTSGITYEIPEVFSLSVPEMEKAYAQVIIDRDLNIELKVSLDEAQSETSEYNTTAYLQAEPRYDGSGKLLSIEWGDARISRGSDSVGGGKS